MQAWSQPPGIASRTRPDKNFALIKSRTIADRMIDRFKLMDLYENKYHEDARRDLDKKTSINAGKDGLITIEMDDHDPHRAAAMANLLETRSWK